MEKAQMILELWRMFLRRFWILATIGILGIAASAFFAYILPPIYQAEAKILVESQQIPDELARSTVTASAAERLQLIEQRLMTRNNLLRLIGDLDLFRDRPDLTVSEKVDLLREATEIRPIALGGRGRRGDTEISAFTIRVTFESPAKATQIANEFVTTVLDQNIKARSRRASETLSFFTQEEERLGTALAELEVRITEYKNENETALPDSLEFRREELTRFGEADRDIDLRLLELEEKRGALEAALSQVANAPPSARTPEEQQLRELNTELVQIRTVYAPNHRKVRALQARIAALEANLPAVPAAGEGGAADRQAAEEDTIRHQMDLLDRQIALLEDQKAALAESRAGIEASIEQTPNIEMTLNALYRRHAELQDQYSVIVRKRTEAETGEKLEINQQAERFEVIENAIVPDQPVSPNRKKVVMLGSVLSLALAGGIAFLVEILRPALRSAAQMERQLELRPVVTIPHIRTRSERRRRALRMLVLVVLICGGIPAALYAVDQTYMPLELVADKIIEKTGLDDYIRAADQRL